MCGHKRVIGKSLGVLSALVIGGCICLGVQPLQYLGSLFDGLDLAQIDSIARLTFDVNDFAQGNITADDLTQRYQRFGRSVEIRPVGSVQTTYFFTTDHVLRQQTIVLPGTITDANLATDLDLVLAPDEKLNIGVHRGFQLNAQAVYNDVKDSLFPYSIAIYGFSLGGATGVLLGAYLQTDGKYVENITTFGQPKVTDEGGAQILQQRLPLHRIISGDDPVTTFPGGDYAHCGDAVILLDGSNIVRLAYGSEGYQQFDKLVIPLDEASFQAHKAYLERIQSKMAGGLAEVPFTDRDCYLSQP
jgi:triacylglycerol lipase